MNIAAWSRPLTVLVLGAALLGLPACASIDRSVQLTEEVVTPVTVGDASAVSAYDLAETMLRSGFSREQILEYGPPLRTALATSGGAQIRINKLIEAVFAIHGDQLYVTSRTRGTFIQPLGEYADKSF